MKPQPLKMRKVLVPISKSSASLPSRCICPPISPLRSPKISKPRKPDRRAADLSKYQQETLFIPPAPQEQLLSPAQRVLSKKQESSSKILLIRPQQLPVESEKTNHDIPKEQGHRKTGQLLLSKQQNGKKHERPKVNELMENYYYFCEPEQNKRRRRQQNINQIKNAKVWKDTLRDSCSPESLFPRTVRDLATNSKRGIQKQLSGSNKIRIRSLEAIGRDSPLLGEYRSNYLIGLQKEYNIKKNQYYGNYRQQQGYSKTSESTNIALVEPFLIGGGERIEKDMRDIGVGTTDEEELQYKEAYLRRVKTQREKDDELNLYQDNQQQEVQKYLAQSFVKEQRDVRGLQLGYENNFRDHSTVQVGLESRLGLEPIPTVIQSREQESQNNGAPSRIQNTHIVQIDRPKNLKVCRRKLVKIDPLTKKAVREILSSDAIAHYSNEHLPTHTSQRLLPIAGEVSYF